MTPEELRQSIDDLNNTIRSLSSVMAGMQESFQNSTTQQRQFFTENSRSITSIRQQREAFDGLTKVEREREEALKKYNQGIDALKGSVTGAISTLSGFAQGLSNTKVSLTNFNQGLSSLGEGFVGVGKQLGPMGEVVGQTVNAFAALLKLTLSYNQAYIDGRDALIKMGGAGSVTAESFQKMARGADLSFLTLNRIIKPLESLGKQVLFLGNTIGEAQANFIKIASFSEEERRRYIRLGLTQEDLMQSTADYISLQSRSGRILSNQAIDAEKLRKANMQYLDSTLALAAVTGQSAEEQKKAQDAMMLDRQFQLKMIGLSAQEKQLREKAALGGPGAAEATAQADKIRREIDSYTKGLKAAALTGLPEFAMALKERAVTGATGELSAGLSQYPGLDSLAATMSRQMEGGELAGINEQKLAATMAQTITESVSKVAPDITAGAMFSPEYTKYSLMGDEQTRSTLLRLLGLKPGESFDKVLADIEKTKRTPSPAADTLAGAQEKMIDFGKWLDDHMPSLTTSITALAIAAGAAAASLGLLAFGKFRAGAALLRGGAPNVAGPVSAAPGAGRFTAAEMDAYKAARAAGRSPQEALNAARGLRGVPGAGTAAAAESAATSSAASGTLRGAARTAGRWLGPAAAVGLGVYEGYSGYSEASDLEKAGQITHGQARHMKGESLGGAAGGTSGALAGAALGAMNPLALALDPFTFGLSSVVGGMAGGALGYFGGNWLGKKAGGAIAGGEDPEEAAETAQENAETQDELSRVLPKLVDSATALDKAFRLLAETTGTLSSGGGAAPGTAAPAGASSGSSAASGAGTPSGSTAAPGGAAAAPVGDPSQSEGQGRPPSPQLTTVRSKGGATASVDRKYAGRFQGLLDDLAKQGYNVYSLGGYNVRNVAGTNAPSAHSWGAALDINAGTNPMGTTLITDMPKNIGQLAAARGLGWGGSWTNKKDAMHFSMQRNEGGIGLEDGGLAMGPRSGYPVTLHGNELVVPLNPNSLLAELGKKTKEEIQNITQTNIRTSTSDNYREILGQNQNMMSMLANKLDRVIEHLGDSNTTQTKILRYARA